ncbi:MAG: hypothetical protein QNJ92_15770 [Alphaproteobacteria bacterium]|nr:hypothetical protein [Alphaproteobacteria bacterium]
MQQSHEHADEIPLDWSAIKTVGAARALPFLPVIEQVSTWQAVADLIDQLPLPALLIHDDESCGHLNEEAARLLGYPRRALRGRSVRDVMPGIDAVAAHPERRRQILARHKSGAMLPIEVCLTEIACDGAKLLLAGMVDRSNTAALEAEIGRLERRLQAEIRHATTPLKERIRKLTAHKRLSAQALAQLGDELREPLNEMLSFAAFIARGLASDDAPTTESVQSLAGYIANNAQSLLDLGDGFTELAAIESGTALAEPEEVDFSGLCHAVCERQAAIARTRGVAFSFANYAGPARIRIDPRGLGHIMRSLVGRAVRSAAADAVVAVTLDRTECGLRLNIDCPDHILDDVERDALCEPLIRAGDAGWIPPSSTSMELYLAKRFLDLQRAELTIATPDAHRDDADGKGYTMHIEFRAKTKRPKGLFGVQRSQMRGSPSAVIRGNGQSAQPITSR